MNQETQNAAEKQKKRRPKLDAKTILMVIGGLALLALVGQGFLGSLTTVPRLVIPPHKLPVPNAYDIYAQAGKTLKSVRVGKKNLRLELMDNGWYSGKYAAMFTRAEANALVQANSQALTLLHQGLASDYMRPAARIGEIENDHSPQDLKLLGKLLIVEAQAKLTHGDHSGAMQSVVDAMQFACDIQHGSAMGEAWTSQSMRRNALTEATQILPHLTAAEMRVAARQLERALTHEVAYSDIMEEEKWRTLAGLMPVLNTFVGPAGFAWAINDEKQGALQQFQHRAQLCLTDRREIVRDYTRYMDQLIACTSQPFIAHQPLPAIPSSPITNALTAYLPRDWSRYLATRAAGRSFMLGLALRAYRLEHGIYPDKLEALVPAYLDRLPIDPFSMQGSFGYKRDKTGYTIFDATGQAVSNN